MTNSDGSTTSYTYTPRAVGALTVHDLTAVTHADGSTETLAYDATGNLTSHIDQLANSESSTYNDIGQELTATNKLGGITTNTYDAASKQINHRDPAAYW